MEYTTPFEIETYSDETVVVQVGRFLDFRTAAAFKVACQEQLRAGKRNFILDFSETILLDSTGLGSIFSLYQQVRARRGEIVFAAVSHAVQAVVQMTRIHRIFRQFATVQTACGAFLKR